MDAHSPVSTPTHKRSTRKNFLFWLMGIIALLVCVSGMINIFLGSSKHAVRGKESEIFAASTTPLPFEFTSKGRSKSITPATLPTTKSSSTTSSSPATSQASTLSTPSTTATSGGVAVSGSQGSWHMTVNGSPYQVKGVTYDAPSNASTDMPALRAMGVNTLRIWNTDATTLSLLNTASTYGIKVISGFVLSQSADYLNDTTYKATQLKTIEQWVNTYKNNPGVLMWDVGNEVLLSLQYTYSGSKLEQERNAYAQFIDQLAQTIHSIDPSHPVTSTDAWTGAWVYYKANAPHLDLYAINSYGSVCNIEQDWINGGYTVPYIVTESGPAGDWEVPKDTNGVPVEQTDVQQSQAYVTAWKCITAHTGVALGATLFNYGVENNFAGVWFNLLPDHLRRLSDFTIAQLYGGQISANTPPVISNMTVGQATVPMKSTFTVKANVSDPNGNTLSYQILFCSKYIDGNTNLQTATFTQTGSGSFSVTAPNLVGIWKVYLYAFDGQGNVGIETLSFKVV